MQPTPYPDKAPQEIWLSQFAIAVVIPCYRVERAIETVLRAIPSYVRHIIAVNDASPDDTQAVLDRVASDDRRIILLCHSSNQGVGGAMVSGFKKALELGAQVIVKMDGDGQMDPRHLPSLIAPLALGVCDYSKGNRFRDFEALKKMPMLRRFGNTALSFMIKAATGYWSCFDPCNGFFGIRAEVLRQLPLAKIHKRYFFESSMLSRLYLVDAVVRDVPMPARYGNEISNLSIKRVFLEFPPSLAVCLLRRIILKKFLYDFRVESLLLLAGMPLLLIGVLYGGISWYHYTRLGIGAPTGTVVIPSLLIILGFQLLLTALTEDLRSVPTSPRAGPLPEPAARLTLAPDLQRPEQSHG